MGQALVVQSSTWTVDLIHTRSISSFLVVATPAKSTAY